jgi:hypothetical protein
MSRFVPLQLILFGLAAALIALDTAWGLRGGFRVDIATYLKSGGLGLVLLVAGIFYQTRRPDPKIAVMLMGTSFLVLFSAAANLLNNYLLTIAGSRIDADLDLADRALGFDWYRMMLAMADHPLLNRILFLIYNIALPEIAVLLVVLALSGQVERAYRLCLSVALGALAAIGIWTLHPAFGAMSLYHLPLGTAQKLVLMLSCEFGHAQVALLKHGPGFITPDALQGSLIGFPSYHCVLALVVSWAARSLPRLRWPLWFANALVIVSTPIQGGHHLVDVLAAFPVAAAVLFIAGLGEKTAKPSRMVNKAPKLTLTPVPEGFFRSTLEQVGECGPSAINPKLSGLP